MWQMNTKNNNRIRNNSISYSSYFSKFKFFVIWFLISINFFHQFKNHIDYYNLSFNHKREGYLLYRFSIIRRLYCPNCGLFSFYIVHLGCINKCLSRGYIPIIDLKSFPNVYNKGNISVINPWEKFFFQPYNYTLEEVEKYAKNIKYYKCNGKEYRPNEKYIYYHHNLVSFWHNFAKKFMPLKKEIVKEALYLMKKLFGNSLNILGVKMRGTDYISLRLKGHSIPPKIEQVISDTKMMDEKYKYDYIFFATEDEIIKKQFVEIFGNKLKLLNPKVIINYNYNNTYMINLNENIYGNLEYIKNYILNTIILSKCLDIITPRCSGAAGIFILTNGFRNTIIYNIGQY